LITSSLENIILYLNIFAYISLDCTQFYGENIIKIYLNIGISTGEEKTIFMV